MAVSRRILTLADNVRKALIPELKDAESRGHLQNYFKIHNQKSCAYITLFENFCTFYNVVRLNKIM